MTCVTDFKVTVQGGLFMFGIQIENDLVYHGIANQPSLAYFSLYLFDFLFQYLE